MKIQNLKVNASLKQDCHIHTTLEISESVQNFQILQVSKFDNLKQWFTNQKDFARKQQNMAADIFVCFGDTSKNKERYRSTKLI